MFNTIVVAVDGSDYASRALVAACDLSQKYSAALHIVHINDVHEQFVGVGGSSVLIRPDDYEKAGQKILEEAKQKAESEGCKVETYQLNGNLGQTVVDKAEELSADLIVLGSKGHSDLAGMLFGSVSHKITHLAKCPCLIVR
ncbi:MAG: universal stress protein [Desulforhopalus sp.]